MGASHDWASIERAIRVERLRPAEISRRFRVPLSTFYYRARRLGWPLPRDAVRQEPDAVAGAGDGLARRLRRIALKRLIELESATPGWEDAPERAVKPVETVLKLLERLDAADARVVREPEAALSGEDRDRRRQELADKLARMLARERAEPAASRTGGSSHGGLCPGG